MDPAELEAGLAEPLVGGGDAPAPRPARRPHVPHGPQTQPWHRKPALPLFLAVMLAENNGPPVRFHMTSSITFDICTFFLVFFVLCLVLFAIMFLVGTVLTRNNSPRGATPSPKPVILIILLIWFIVCQAAPYHFNTFLSESGTWVMAPLELFNDWHATDVQYICPPVLVNETLNETLNETQYESWRLVNETPTYDNGFLCGSWMNPFFLHWRPVVWGMLSYKQVIIIAWLYPSLLRSTAAQPLMASLGNNPCGMRMLFLAMIPFIMIATLTDGLVNTSAVARMVYIYFFDVFRRIYNFYQGTPVNEDGQPEPIKTTDIMAVLVFVWWLSLPGWIPEIQSYIPMATGEHVNKVLKEKGYHAKIKKNATFSMMHQASSMMLTGSIDDAKSLEGKRTDLIQDATDTACQKLAKNASAPATYTLTGIRREHILEDSLSKLKEANTFELLAKTFYVNFLNEAGIDAGGVTRDWFDSMAQAIAHNADKQKSDSLLHLTTDDTLLPRNTGVDDDADTVSDDVKPRLDNLYTVGRFLALAVLRKHPLPLAFGTVLMKAICDEEIDYRDVRRLDPDFYRIRVEMIMKKGGVAEMNDALGDQLTFMSAADEDGVEPKNLKDGGFAIKVTEENKKEYVMLLCEAKLCNGIRKELQIFLAGFHEVLEIENLRGNAVTHRDLSLLISGIPTIDVKDWSSHTQVQNSHSPQLTQWFWEVVGELDAEQKARLLQFSTGSSRVPPGGFKDIKPPFKLTVTEESGEHLPHSHTCFNQLMLAKYESKEQLKEKIITAIEVGEMAGFGFA